MNDEFYMNLALDEAWKYQLLTYPNPAVGCVVVDKFGKILSISAHKKAGFLHAEANAVFTALCKINNNFLNKFIDEYKAKFGTDFSKFNSKFNQILDFESLNTDFVYEFIIKNHENLLKNAKAFVSLEPCSHTGKTPPCANLLLNLGFSEIVIGSKDLSESAKGGGEILDKSGIKVKFGVLKERCDELIEPFLAWSNGNFSFFKLAMSLNGVITGGIISSKISRSHAHEIRSLVDLLVIGGNTVRTDKPILDARFAKNPKAPDVLIYSNSSKFDPNLPLFQIKNRQVNIKNSLNLAWEKKFVMFEGGENFLKNLPPNIKWLLIYRSNRFLNEKSLNLDLNLKILHQENFGDDTKIWYKIIH